MINVRIHNGYPNVRVSSFQTTRSGESSTTESISAGTPIGLLLLLTYAEAVVTSQSLGPFGDYRPSVRIN